jgi:hypothetical protein
MSSFSPWSGTCYGQVQHFWQQWGWTVAVCKPCSSLVDTKLKVSAEAGTPTQDPSDFRSLTGALHYLTFTQPDISYVVQQICLHMHDPREPHLAVLKHILRYIRGTLNLGLVLRPSCLSKVVVYSDADWAGCPNTLNPHQAMQCSLVTISSPWSPSAKRQCPAPMLKSSIALWLVPLWNHLVALASARAPHWNKS